MHIRLAELLAPLSLVTDLGMGHPPAQAMRSCLLATGLARNMNVPREELASIYYTTLLLHSGCTAYAHELALQFGGDDIAVREVGAKVDFSNPREFFSGFLLQVARDAPLRRRARSIGNALVGGKSSGEDLNRATCEVAAQMASRIGLEPLVQRSLLQMFERWDGKGTPLQLAGEALNLPIRFAQVASQAVLFASAGGSELALEVIGRRSGTALDPFIADGFARYGPELLRAMEVDDIWSSVVSNEPEPHRRIPEHDLDEIARAFGDAVDLKAPFLHGHSIGVARLAESAAQVLDLDDHTAVCLRRAGCFHDLGRVGVPTGIWEKPGPLTRGEWEQVRLHPYHSERILAGAPLLAEIATLSGMHHERQDGSGYFRGVAGSAIALPARILAAADAFQAMTQHRPYRPAMNLSMAAGQLEAEATQGRLDGDAAHAVLVAARQRAPGRRRHWPAGLTDREIEVLRLVTRGYSNREIGRELSISPKTAGHHVQHIYDKVGCSTRASAAMFAMEHELLSDEIRFK